MTVSTKTPSKRLTLQVAEIAADTTVIRSLDWDRDRFDVEFGLQNGTTYNSYLIQGEKVALVDSSHEKFRDRYLQQLQDLIDPRQIDYLIVSHTEPDHSGLIRYLLELAPNAVVVASKVALQFLEGLVHQPFERKQVKSGDFLDLGKGHVLEFVSAPNLHWPDTMLTYDRATQVLYTCDVFGMHYCSEPLWDEDLEAIAPDYHFYYECLMAPNTRSVISALKRIDKLGEISTVANGHGPLLRYNVAEAIGWYRQWSQGQAKGEKTVAVFYISDYGYSERLSQAIAAGISKVGLNVRLMDLVGSECQEVRLLVESAAGIVIGMPPLSGNRAQQATTTLNTILASVNNKQIFGVFESYGGDDEPIDPILTRLRDLGLREIFPGIRITETPDEGTYKLCEEAGTDVGQWLTCDRAIDQMESLDDDLDKAMGRLSGGLYIITAQQGNVKSAMLASWVAQASFEPLGISIAVAKDRAIESLLQIGDRFVLNVLEEGNYQHLMKRFLKRFKPGADRFEGIKTQIAASGTPILTEALAYLECEVVDRLECSDHWVIYSKVEDGNIAKPEARTATHHRQVGNHY